MKILTTPDGTIFLEEIYNGVGLRTAEGNLMGVCMRDDTFEFSITPNNGETRWFRVDMQKQTVEHLYDAK